MDEISALKQALLLALRASTSLAALVDNRIYDVPPTSPALPATPYIRFGPFSSEDSGADCFESYDVVGQIDVYSSGTDEAASTMESNKVAGIVVSIIRAMQDNTTLSDDHVLSEIIFRNRRSITASDGKTKQVPITFYATVDKT